MILDKSINNQSLASGIELLNEEEVKRILRNGGTIRASKTETAVVLHSLYLEGDPVQLAAIDSGLWNRILKESDGLEKAITELLENGFAYEGKISVSESGNKPAAIGYAIVIITSILTKSTDPLNPVKITSHSFDQDLGVGRYKRPLDQVILNILNMLSQGVFGMQDLAKTGTLAKICSDQGISEQELLEALKARQHALKTMQAKRQRNSDSSFFGLIEGFAEGIFAMSESFAAATSALSESLFPATSAKEPAKQKVTNSERPIFVDATVTETTQKGSEIKRRLTATLEGQTERKEARHGSGTARSTNNDSREFHRMAVHTMQEFGSRKPACERNRQRRLNL